jgi:inhibitor of KinA sporulation pathway (predicted exonuclease)/endonuclease YncB( thermonuclease family)
MKKIFIYLIFLSVILFPSNVLAANLKSLTTTTKEVDLPSNITGKTTTTVQVSGDKIDWSKPIMVSVVGMKDIDTFTVKYQNQEFDITLFGIDIATNIENKEETLNNFDKEIFTRLLRSNYLILEKDETSNLYNKNHEIQVWVWTNNSLFQNELISEGIAKLDTDICKYSTCEKYYDILYKNQESAQKSLSGIWGAEKYTLNYNVGGNKRMFNLSNSQILFIGGISAICLAILIIIVIAIIISKKNKKQNQKQVIKTQSISKEVVDNEKQSEIDENKEEEIKVDNQLASDITIQTAEPEKIEEVQNINITNNNILPELKNVTAKNKDILLNVIPTLFNPKDPRAKEVPETIKLELTLVDNDLNAEKYFWYVKPMKFTKLSPYCKERTDVTQIDVNNGILFEDVVKAIMPLFEECDNIYSWGKGCYLQFEKEGYEKLDDMTYNKILNIFKTKYVNHKEDFATRNEITPCSLVKAADMSDQVKEQNAIDTELNIYVFERN